MVALGTLIIGLLVPSNNPNLNLSSKNAGSSPFVIAIQRAGIKGLPSVSRTFGIPIKYILKRNVLRLSTLLYLPLHGQPHPAIFTPALGLCVSK